MNKNGQEIKTAVTSAVNKHSPQPSRVVKFKRERRFGVIFTSRNVPPRMVRFKDYCRDCKKEDCSLCYRPEGEESSDDE
jgi:hypothetical protein